MAFSNATTTVGSSALPATFRAEVILVFRLFLGVCFLVGIPGNALVIWTIVAQLRQHSTTIRLLLHLAVADLLALLTLPLWIFVFGGHWVLGSGLCRLVTYLVYLCMYASVFLITLISLHRCLALRCPLAWQQWQRPKVVSGVVGATWALAAGCAGPVLVFLVPVEPSGQGRCPRQVYDSGAQRLAVNVTETLFGFIFPLSILLVCSTCVARGVRQVRSPRGGRAERLVAAVVVAFFVCWAPFHICNLTVISSLLLEPSAAALALSLQKAVEAHRPLATALAFFSSSLNPVLYAFFACHFRKGLRATQLAKFFGQMNEPREEEPLPKSPGDGRLGTATVM
ncbi:C3a anaphylatoxin chemotactic receptor-like [Ornithorhynchus anatinus]|uniref:G-protein coupled receptors family 1 profile domain-containing protein n=1 Tax=Ornithorhynchus anatinus TaxID=9258 RepID=A0A6I8NGD9_ORNAN|nr:C3a anaphylatoxin chemotactic receptor-like [Ornithorhynchus anatinus]